ncbi:putative ribonuclease H-like domain-containing protein [Tanacetum coccineum]
MRSFQTKQSVNKTNVSDGLFKQVTQQNLPQIRKQAVRNTNVIAPGPSRNCPKHVSHQSPREKVGSNDMNKDAKSHKTTKRYLPVEKSSASKKPKRQIPTGHRFSNKKTTTVPEKTMNPRSCLRWKPTGRIFSNVRLRWIPTGKLLNSCTGKVDSEPAHGSIVDIPHIHACKQTLGLSAGTSFNGQKQQQIDLNADALYNEKQENLRVWLLKLLISKKPVPECSGLVLHQMTSDHNRSELGIHDHSNEPSSSKLVPKVVPLAVKTATSRQELELLFHHHIAMLRTTEHPSDTNVFTMKMEILLEPASNKLLFLKESICKNINKNVLKSEFEKVKQEKEGIKFKIKKFDKALKDLDKLLGSQITDKSKKGLGYSAVPPPHPLIYNRPKKLDLSYSGLDEFKEPEFKAYDYENSEQESNVVCDKNSDDSKENSDESLVNKYQKTQINCDQHQRKRIVSRNNYNRVDYDYYAKTTHPTLHKNMTPRIVLLKTGLTPLNAVRLVNTAHPKPAVHSAKSMSHFSKQAQSTAHRPFYKQTTLTRRSMHTAKRHYYTEWPRVGNTARSYIGPVNAVREKGGKPQQDDTGFVDNGCSRRMTGNIAYLSDFKEFDGGYVTFGGGAHGGRISSKGTLKTDSLDFEDVYFVNELKFNLFIEPDENQILLKIPRKDNIEKGIKREYSVARTPQQNGVAERRNRTLIEAARTMLADSKLPTTFWAEAVSTACYVQNRVLVVKPHNKTPYELFRVTIVARVEVDEVESGCC